jgi:Transcription factor WhiB
VSNYTSAVPDTRRRKPDWRTHAACRADNISPDAMFPDSDKRLIAEARAICAGCPVSRLCLRDAISSGDNQWGIRGGLTPEERRAVQKELNRRHKAAQKDPESAPAETPKPPARKSYTDLRSLFDGNTKRLIHGHLAWTGPSKPSFEGRSYNPKQVAFLLDRGRAPVGRVLTTCSLSGCVLAAHIADDEERARCGTRPGYQRHRRLGQAPCDPCKRANTDADNRLRRTGSTKVAA